MMEGYSKFDVGEIITFLIALFFLEAQRLDDIENFVWGHGMYEGVAADDDALWMVMCVWSVNRSREKEKIFGKWRRCRPPEVSRVSGSGNDDGFFDTYRAQSQSANVTFRPQLGMFHNDDCVIVM